MTFGGWLDRAHVNLVATVDAVSSGPPVDVNGVGSLIEPRRQAYAALARLVVLLTGGQPVRVDASTRDADRAMGRVDHERAGLYVGLQAAATLLDPYPLPRG